jgi:peptidoglycan/LPS O-acetylase OafA/YrhL
MMLVGLWIETGFGESYFCDPSMHKLGRGLRDSNLIFLSQLHGLRGLLSLVVMAYHFNIWFNWSQSTSQLWARAVDGFVVLSGFIITRRVLTNNELPLTTFLLHRLIRLSPIYYLAIAAIITAHFMSGRTSIDILDVSLHFLYAHNFFNRYTQSLDGAFWSVGLEMSLYVTFAIMMSSVRRHSVPLVWLLITSNIVCFLVCVIVRFSSPQFTESLLYGRHLFSRWIQFSAGVWLFLSNGQLLGSNLKRLTWLTLLLGSLLVVVAGKLPFLHNYFWAVIVMVVMNFILSNRSCNFCFSHPVLQWFGTISYPMYLIHGTVFYLFSHFGKKVSSVGLIDKDVLTYVPFGIVFVVAYLIALVESRVIRWLKDFVH